jgi:hypothetical protein
VDALFFPEQEDGKEIQRKIGRCLTACTARDLRILLAAIETMIAETNQS